MRKTHLQTNFYETSRNRYFLGFGKKESTGRAGAMTADEIKKNIKEHGVGKKVTVQRVDYEGIVSESTPIIIASITLEGFSGRVVNVEREVREEDSDAQIFIEGGGGSIEFNYNDGDIASIEEDIDNEIVQSKDKTEILEILEALDPGDEIIVSYYDKESGGFKNGCGELLEKDLETESLSFHLRIMNEIPLKQPRRVDLSLLQDTILDLQIMI